MTHIYTLKTCDSCRKATKWLRENEISYEEIAIRERAPTLIELERALTDLDGDIRKLFNISGQDYRAQNLKEKLPTISKEEALALLNSNGNLIKRPFLTSNNTTLIGFNQAAWSAALL